MNSESVESTQEVQQGSEDSLADTLQEMWSMQREVLKEMISGFRRLEQSQAELQANVTQQLEAQADQLQEARVAKPHPEFIQLIEERFGQVNTRLQQLDGIQAAIDQPDTVLQGQLKETQDIVFSSLVETREALQADLQEIRTTVGHSLETSTGALQEQLEHLKVASHSDLSEAKTAILNLLQQSQSHLHQEFNREITQLREAISANQESLKSSLVETRRAVEESLQAAASRSEDQTAGKLDGIADNLKHVHELRKKVEKTLDELTREVRDVGAVAGRLESSTVLTQELLDEQRTISALSQEREKRNEARTHNNAGVLCYHQGAYDSSVEHFKKALELDSSMAEAYNNLGLSYTEMGDNDRASDAFRQALELDPMVGQVYNNLGYLYHRRGELEHAVEMYQRAIQRSTDTSAAYSNLGNALYQLKRVDESVTAWKKAVEVDPSNQKAAAALERLGLESSSN